MNENEMVVYPLKVNAVFNSIDNVKINFFIY